VAVPVRIQREGRFILQLDHFHPGEVLPDETAGTTAGVELLLPEVDDAVPVLQILIRGIAVWVEERGDREGLGARSRSHLAPGRPRLIRGHGLGVRR
jgi:hypothetical protein